MSDNKPTAFKDLDVKELRRSAVEDFAVEAGPKDNKTMVIAALTEAGVTWNDYVAQHPEVKPEPVAPVVPAVPTRETEPDRGNVVTSASLDAGSLTTENIQQETVKVHVQEPLTPRPTDKYLVKMLRSNPRYDTRGYTFTQQHPYNLVNGEDLEYILSKEDGFRQALPSELSEYYG